MSMCYPAHSLRSIVLMLFKSETLHRLDVNGIWHAYADWDEGSRSTFKTWWAPLRRMLDAASGNLRTSCNVTGL